MFIGSPKEIFKGENRVALTPESAKQLQKLGYTCLLETGAGINANFSDIDYKNAGVKVVKNANELWKLSDIILKVRGPEISELSKAVIQVAQMCEGLANLAKCKVQEVIRKEVNEILSKAIKK